MFLSRNEVSLLKLEKKKAAISVCMTRSRSKGRVKMTSYRYLSIPSWRAFRDITLLKYQCKLYPFSFFFLTYNCRFLILREYLIPRFNSYSSNREKIKSRTPIFVIISYSLHADEKKLKQDFKIIKIAI